MDDAAKEGVASGVGTIPALGWEAVGRASTEAKPWSWRALVVALLALSGLAIAVDAFLIEPDWVELTRSIEYVPSLPPSAPDLTVIHLSDPHVARLGARERRAIEMINGARPDLILVTGDLTRRPASATDLQAFLGSLRARYGRFAVWGNHDYWDRAASTWGPDTLARSGFVLLRNDNRRIAYPGGPVVVAGVDDPVTGHDSLRLAMRGVRRSDLCLLLAHSPEIASDLGNWDIDLVFAGHTHGGQVRLPGIGALLVPPGTRPYVEGWFNVTGGARLHVSRGLGWSWIRVRFFCRPRIDVITLRGGRPPGARAPRTIIGRS
jgi:predicted MPP superfamily phosphohydrolase